MCVCDPSEPTAGERSVSALGHQSGAVNFLLSASQLLSLLTERKSGETDSEGRGRDLAV